jgi:hypothetical protein
MRRYITRIHCRAVLEEVLPHPVVQHLVALHPVVTVLENEFQTRDAQRYTGRIYPLKNEIRITGNGVVVSKHASRVICAYDSRHRIVRVPMEGGTTAELVQERSVNGALRSEYRSLLLTITHGTDASIIEYSGFKSGALGGL